MAPYNKTPWKDRVVENPRTYQIQENEDGTITLIPAPGTIHEAGTPVIAANMNKIEQGIADALPKDGSEPMTGPLQVEGQITATGKVTTNGGWAGLRANSTTGTRPEVDLLINDVRHGLITAYPDHVTLRRYNPANGTISTEVRLFDDGSVRVGNNNIWHRGDLRWNPEGFLEYNNGGTWRPVGGVKGVQRGLATVPNGTSPLDVTISSVNLQKSILHINWLVDWNTSSTDAISSARAYLLNGTTIRVEVGGGSNRPPLIFAWQVEESY